LPDGEITIKGTGVTLTVKDGKVSDTRRTAPSASSAPRP
jgi:hypothetical protein